MKLFLSILFSTLLCVVLTFIHPIIAAFTFAGIVLGCLFRGLYLLYEIHEQIVPKKDKVQAAVNRHLEERERNNLKES